jgi:N utilization substance protein A
MGASREAGVRAKIAVASNNSDIDPVGACVGMKGSRVQNVVQELRGEKIDIIPWHIDSAKFVCNALAPAEISRVIIDESNNLMEVIVPDEFLSIAIGKKGQNVRLASKLTGWHLDVKSETRYNEAMQTGYDSLVALPGVGISLADALYESGFYSAEEISEANIEDLVQIRGIGEEKAVKLLEAAQNAALDAAKENEVAEDEIGDEATETETINAEDAQQPSEPADEAEPEPSDEADPEPADEVEPEPSDEADPEPADEVEPEPSDEADPEPADEVEPEPSDEVEPENKND